MTNPPQRCGCAPTKPSRRLSTTRRFYAAQSIIRERAKHYSDEDMLDLLRGLLEQHG